MSAESPHNPGVTSRRPKPKQNAPYGFALCIDVLEFGAYKCCEQNAIIEMLLEWAQAIKKRLHDPALPKRDNGEFEAAAQQTLLEIVPTAGKLAVLFLRDEKTAGEEAVVAWARRNYSWPINFACEMISQVHAHNDAGYPSPEFNVRVGLDCGELTLARRNEKWPYVTGQAFTSAQRLTQYGDAWHILASEHFRRWLPEEKREEMQETQLPDPDNFLSNLPHGKVYILHSLCEAEEPATSVMPKLWSLKQAEMLGDALFKGQGRQDAGEQQEADDQSLPIIKRDVAKHIVSMHLERLRTLTHLTFHNYSDLTHIITEMALLRGKWTAMELISAIRPIEWEDHSASTDQQSAQNKWYKFQCEIFNIASESPGGDARRLHVFPQHLYHCGERDDRHHCCNQVTSLFHLMIAEAISHIRPRLHLYDRDSTQPRSFYPFDSATIFGSGGIYKAILSDIDIDKEFAEERLNTPSKFQLYDVLEEKRQRLYEELQANFYHGWRAETPSNEHRCTGNVRMLLDVYAHLKWLEQENEVVFDYDSIAKYLPEARRRELNSGHARLIQTAFERLESSNSPARVAERALMHCLTAIPLF